MNSFARDVFISLLIIFACAPAFAQTERSRLEVRVVEEGKPVAGATVTLLELQTQRSRTQVTNETGPGNLYRHRTWQLRSQSLNARSRRNSVPASLTPSRLCTGRGIAHGLPRSTSAGTSYG